MFMCGVGWTKNQSMYYKVFFFFTVFKYKKRYVNVRGMY